MSTNTGEIQPITSEVWVQPELNRKDVQVIPPVAKAEGGTTNKAGDDKRENTPPDTRLPGELAGKVQSYLDETLNVQLNFQVDAETGHTVVQVLDRTTGKLIRQIPRESLVQVHQKLEELRGFLFDGTA